MKERRHIDDIDYDILCHRTVIRLVSANLEKLVAEREKEMERIIREVHPPKQYRQTDCYCSYVNGELEISMKCPVHALTNAKQ